MIKKKNLNLAGAEGDKEGIFINNLTHVGDGDNRRDVPVIR